MRIVDLTHKICSEMPVYPGTEKPELIPANSYEADGFRETKLCMYSHTGTHIDSPSHLFDEKMTLDQFPVSQFIGKALSIDCTCYSEGETIGLECLKRYGKKIEKVDFLLFRLDWDKKWGTDAYFGNYPYLSCGLMDFILEHEYKGIGFDVIGLDPIGSLSLHKKLFEHKRMINIENLCCLDSFGDEIFMFSCFPLKVENSDGAPCRAVGWLIEE